MTANTTQGRHPWRATLRTGVAVALGLLPLVPEILAGAHLSSSALGGQVLGIAAGVTRVLAIPGVERLLHTYAPWLAAAPKPDPLPLPNSTSTPVARWPDDAPTQEGRAIR